MRRIALVAVLITCAVSRTGAAEDAPGEMQTAADLLPASVVLYAEMQQPPAVLEMLLEHPLRPRLEALPAYQTALQNEQLVPLKAAVSIFEAGMGMRWPEVYRTVTAGGVYVAVDAKTQGVALLMQSADAETMERFVETLVAGVRAAQGGKGKGIQEGEYRGYRAYSMGDGARLAVLGKWLLVTNQAELGKLVINQLVDGGKANLQNKPTFEQALTTRPTTPGLWGFADVAALRQAGAPKELYAGRTDNPFLELLVGGIFSNLQHTPFATAALKIDAQAAELSLATPHQSDWGNEQRSYYFGLDGQGRAPALLAPEERLFALSAYRGLSEMWLRAGDLMSDNANEGLARADTQLTTFFSGRDFGEEILGSFESELQFVAVRQSFENQLPRPAIQLPAFALQVRMKQPEETQPELRRVFQSFIGFINVTGATNGQPQFDLATEKKDDYQLVTATYVPDRDAREATDAPINFNFSPSLAFQGDRLILSSSRKLAESLASSTNAPAASSGSNTLAELDAATLKQVLTDNHGQLVAQNMLNEGHTQAEAESETDLLLELVGLFRNATLSLDAGPDALRLKLGVQLAEEAQ